MTTLEVRHLSFDYPDGRRALQDISFRVEEGEKVALLGANGAGKSTLLMHLNGILQGDGQVLVKGMQVNKDNLGAIRAAVGLVFQNPDDQLFSSTVFEDVAYGPRYQGLRPEDVQGRVGAALAAVGMEGFDDRNPYYLSNGEKKRIATATVLSMRVEVLLLDEPTASLDPRGKRELIAFLTRQPQTMLVATHDLHLASQLASRAILLSRGQVVFDGDLSRILADEEMLAEHGLR